MQSSSRETPVTKPNIIRDYEPFISLIVPVFNERDVIDLFLEKTSSVMEEAGLHYEYVFINDGSTDTTLDKLIDLSISNPHIRVINLSRNFGKEAGMTAGKDYMRYKILLCECSA